jgi:hypothetical protein
MHPTSLGSPFTVRLCGCGSVHLGFGATVVSVTAETALSISETLNEAAAELRRRAQSQDPVNADQAAIDPCGNVIPLPGPWHPKSC